MMKSCFLPSSSLLISVSILIMSAMHFINHAQASTGRRPHHAGKIRKSTWDS
jgi:hypothetical protein